MKKLLSVLVVVFALSTTVFSQSLSNLIVKLAWDANPERDLAGYNVYYRSFGTSAYTKTNVGLTTNFSLAVTPSTLYSFAVTAYNTNALESELSAEVRSQSFYVNANGQPTTVNLADFKNTNWSNFTIIRPLTNGTLGGNLPTVTYVPSSKPVIKDIIGFRLSETNHGTNVFSYYSFHPVPLNPPTSVAPQ